MSCSVISCWQSQIELNTSPTAIGVVVCWRISRKPSCSSAGTGSSIQIRRYGSRLLAEPGRLDRGEPVVHVVQQLQRPGPNSSRTAGEEPRHDVEVRARSTRRSRLGSAASAGS